MKRCSKCGEIMPLWEFSFKYESLITWQRGPVAWCKSCHVRAKKPYVRPGVRPKLDAAAKAEILQPLVIR